MRILAIETSSRIASAALLEDERVVAAHALPEDAGTASELAPAIAALLEQAAWRAGELQLIAVAVGPGSFTGLRVGVTMAKSLAYALRCEVLGVDTLEAIAAQAPAEAQRVCAVVDAQRQQLFSGRFERGPQGELRSCRPAQIIDNDAWLSGLSAEETLTGPGLQRLIARMPAATSVAPQEAWLPRAETVGRLALRDYRAGRRGDLWKLLPHYYRKSAAEEKLAASSSDFLDSRIKGREDAI